tara:strand:- start:658 stop:918 length:261 start_codon:yes stop_codon:yes gene_type:complete
MKFISEKTSKRVCDHMNKDHLDSVHKYLKFYANISEFKNATLEEINSSSLKIKYDDKYAVIKFDEEISENEIHDKLVSMIRNIKNN